jgi:signal transduction histidine kinase
VSDRKSFWLAWSICGLCIGTLIAGVAMGIATHSLVGDQAGDVGPTVATLIFVLAFATVGALLAWKVPSNPIGWLLACSALCYAAGGAGEFLKRFDGAGRFGDWMGSWTWGLGVALAGTFVLLLFPTGALPSRRWRPIAWVGAVSAGAFVLGNMFAPGLIEGTRSINPIGIGGALGPVFRFLRIGQLGTLATSVLAIVSVGVRFRRARSTQREQLKWLVFAGVLVVLGAVAQIPLEAVYGSGDFTTNISNTVVSGAFSLVPLAVAIAVLKYRLYDIDVVINKTVVYAALAGFITAVYVGIVVGMGAAIGQGSKPNLGLSILATAVVAVAFQPVRARVQRLANRLVYGKRATPYEVLAHFSERMVSTYGADELLPQMARILAEGTGAAGADVWLKVGNEIRVKGSWPEDNVLTGASVELDGGGFPTIPRSDLSTAVRDGGELLGAVAITKARGEPVTQGDRKLLSDLASQAGFVLRNVKLIEELRASRQRIVSVRDEERRRLERNIHDGAQQQVVALAMKLGLARGLARKDLEKTKALLTQLQHETQDALDNLRELARGIYPPLLADQGLRAALEAQARRSPIPVTIDSDGIARYSQDVEAAVYFCTLEALQNVTKYADAGKATISLFASDGDLTFTVADDGSGFDVSKTSYGTGLQGMADRLEAVGGRLEVRSRPGEGTEVTGRLPVPALEAGV